LKPSKIINAAILPEKISVTTLRRKNTNDLPQFVNRIFTYCDNISLFYLKTFHHTFGTSLVLNGFVSRKQLEYKKVRCQLSSVNLSLEALTHYGPKFALSSFHTVRI